MIWPGEEQAWDLLSKLDPRDVQTRAGVSFNATSFSYSVPCLGQEVCVCVAKQNFSSVSACGTHLINEIGQYSRLSILRYLVHVQNIPLSGKLLKPADLPGGDIFMRGTHVLPLDRIARRFDSRAEQFFNKCTVLGGIKQDYGDTSCMLYPLPRLPIVLIVWSGDKEFAAHGDLLFDSTCTAHAPTDILWAIAMMSVAMMLA